MKDDGGPAYPVDTRRESAENGGEYGHQTGNTTWQFPGMSMRDYFAAKAMAAYIAADELYSIPCRELAISAYEISDAMLAERAKP